MNFRARPIIFTVMVLVAALIIVTALLAPLGVEVR